jgi:hypothetical protein
LHIALIGAEAMDDTPDSGWQQARSARGVAGLRPLLLGLAALLFGPGALQAQAPAPDWPVRPVRVLVGYPAGGANDLIARAVAARLGEALKQPVVVENKTGAAGSIAADAAAKAAPDGYTLYMMSSAQVLAPSVRNDITYDPAKASGPSRWSLRRLTSCSCTTASRRAASPSSSRSRSRNPGN